MRSNGHHERGAGNDDMNRHLSGRASANPRPVNAGRGAADITANVGDPVARLLAAAAAPGSPRELRGEDAAALAFRSAAAMPAPSAIRDRRKRRLTIAVAAQAACALVVAAAGVALAAGTGVLPNPLVDVSTAQPAPPTARPVSTESTAELSPTTPRSGAVSDSPQPYQPAAELFGLCQAYQAHGGDGPSMESEAFAALVAAAGGPDRVADFCADVLVGEPGKSGDEHVQPTTPPGQSAQGAGSANREANAGLGQ